MDYKAEYRRWLEEFRDDPETVQELLSLEGNEKEIEDRLYTELEFGTAGMRGVLGAGLNRMNQYNVRRATLGLARYIAEDPERQARGVVIASDTLVSLDGRPLGKPADESEAHAMLRALSGRAHEVFTGVCLRDAATGREMVEEVKTAVRFRELTDEEIWDYIRTGEPMDKAGAYGIQGGAGAFVEGLDGSFENVMGFPVDDVERMLRAFTYEG